MATTVVIYFLWASAFVYTGVRVAKAMRIQHPLSAVKDEAGGTARIRHKARSVSGSASGD